MSGRRRCPASALALACALTCHAQAVHPPRVTLIRVDTAHAQLRLFLRDAAGRPYRTFDRIESDLAASGHHLAAAMNGGMYQADLSPVGLFVGDGRRLHDLDTSAGSGNFYLQPNGVFAVTKTGPRIVLTADYANAPPADDVQATQSGPLLWHGALAPAVAPPPREGARASRYTRNGVCVDGSVVTLAIADTPMTLREFALHLRDVAGCRDALYLDGAISKLYDRRTGRDDQGADMGPVLAVVESPGCVFDRQWGSVNAPHMIHRHPGGTEEGMVVLGDNEVPPWTRPATIAP